MKLYNNKSVYIIGLLYSVAIAAAPTQPITKFAPIIGKNSIKNVYFKKGSEQNLMNIGFNVYVGITGTGNPNRSYYLMLNEAGTMYQVEHTSHPWYYFGGAHHWDTTSQHEQRSVVSTLIRRALLDLTSQDWQNGIYFYPYMVDSNGAFIKSYSPDLTNSTGAEVRLAIFDHEWNLILSGEQGEDQDTSSYAPADDKISTPLAGNPQYAYPGNINFSPGSMSFMLLGGVGEDKAVQILHQDPISWGNVIFVQAVDNVPEPILDASSQSTLYSLPASSVNVGALSIPRGQMKQFTVSLDFGTAGIAALPIQVGSSNMNTLNTSLATGSIGFDISLVENSTNGYDATLTAYQGGKSIFSQPFKGLQNQIKETLKGTAVLSSVSLEYQTDGMGSSTTRSLGKVTQFVLVTTRDSASSGTMLADKETLTQLDAGFILSQGYDQYSVIVPVSSANITLINNAIKNKQGEIAVTTKLSSGDTNYGVTVTATAGGNQLFTQSTPNIQFTNMSTKAKAALATSSDVQVIVENIGYQTTNMTKGMLVPNSSTYSFVPNTQSIVMDLSGYQAPTNTDTGSGVGSDAGSNPYAGAGTGSGSGSDDGGTPTHHTPTARSGFGGRF